MLPVVFQAGLFEKPLDERDWKYSNHCLEWMLECLVNINRSYLRIYPETPPLYRSGTVYAREKGTEDWASIKVLLRVKQGDCEDLGAWRVAELRERGKEFAKPRVKFRNVEGFWHYHIQVQRANGKVEDPSRNLGMNSVREGKPLSHIRMLRITDFGV